MKNHHITIKEKIPLLFLILSALVSILIIIWCIEAGYTAIFQNILYIPIILACVIYPRQGFIFSCFLALTYFTIMIGYTKDETILLQAFLRLLFFICIAGVITLLASAGKRIEETNLELSEFQNNVISSARVWLMVLDLKGIILLWNKAAEDISGYRSGEVIGKNDIWKLLYPEKEYRKQITQTITRIITEEKYLENFETTIYTKSGSQRVISWNTRGMYDKTGTVSSYTAIGVDVTDRYTAQKILTQQTNFLNVLIDTLPVPIFYKNREGTYTGCNTAFEEYFGKPRDQIIGKKVYDIWPEEMADLYYNADQIVFSSSHTHHYEGDTKYADGSVHQVIFYKAPFKDENNQVTGLVGIIMDVTEIRQGEEALRESEKHYRSLFENMLEGYAYCHMIYDEQSSPSDWVCVDVNNAFERLTGFSDAKGKLMSDLIPGIRDMVPELFHMLNRVILTGIPETVETYFPPLENWFHISAYKPKEGNFVIVFENITDRKLAEERLQTIIREHQTILKNVPALIWFKDTNNRYLKVNPAASQVFGRPISEIEGKTFSELFPDRKDLYYQDDIEVIQSKKPKIGILEEIISAQGEHLWVQSDKVPLFDDNGEVIGVLVVSTDITERKLAKDAISFANKKLNLLSSITRHDIGNELQVIFGYLEFALEDDLSVQVKSYIDKANISAHHIERQLAFTRDYQDIGVQTPVWQNVSQVISQSVKNLDIRPIQIQIEIAELEAFADPLLVKVFYNLIDNARRYGEKITEIRFFGIEGEDGYTIIVEDDGVGIPEEYKLKIFNREYYKHTGFGLNLSQEILSITGLSIRETGIAGIGAQFEILVPKNAYRIKNSN
jgi:PAS domain S-box-containing protein